MLNRKEPYLHKLITLNKRTALQIIIYRLEPNVVTSLCNNNYGLHNRLDTEMEVSTRCSEPERPWAVVS